MNADRTPAYLRRYRVQRWAKILLASLFAAGVIARIIHALTT